MQPNSTTYLYLTIGDSFYLYPITDVQEVSEMLHLRPYPYDFQNHLGVVNLKGQIIPIFSINGHKVNSTENQRLIISSFRDDLFAFTCKSVRKIILTDSQKKDIDMSQITDIEKRPVKLLLFEDLFKKVAA